MKKDLALFGIGRWGKNLARNFYELGVLNTICDTSKKTVAELSSHFKNVNFTSDENDIFENSNINKVVIATPVFFHKELIIKALKYKKDIFVEKPLCMNLNEAKEILKYYKNSKNIVMVGHLLHYHPCIEEIKKMIKKGAIGKIASIQSNRLNLGTIRNEEDVFWSFAPHDISIILSLINEKVEDISVFSENILNKNNADIFYCHLKFKSNIKASIKTSWLNPYKEQKLSIIGTDGMILFDDLALWNEKIKYYKHHVSEQENNFIVNKSNFEFIKIKPEEPLNNECKHFLSCSEKRKKPITSIDEGIQVVELLDKITSFTKTKKSNKAHFFAHNTSTIGKANIGTGTKIWHYCHIMEGASIGQNCNIGQNVFIQNGAIVKNNVKIQNNVSVYAGVICEDDVFLGPSMVFTNVKRPRSHFPCNKKYSKTLIKKGTTIGANATIICGITIGEYSFIGAGSVVTKDVKPFSIMAGNPAKQIGWISKKGNKLNLPIIGKENKNYKVSCPEEKKIYHLLNGMISTS